MKSGHHRITPNSLRGSVYHRLLLVAVIAISLFTVVYWQTANNYSSNARQTANNYSNGQRCFGEGANAAAPEVIRLPDIMDDSRKPTPGRSVLFHETSCGSQHGVAHLNSRQACAIESAALTSPEWDVFVLFASPSGLAKNSRSSSGTSDEPLPPWFEAVLTYGNVFMRNVNVWTYAEDTPLAAWMRSEVLFKSKFLNSHTSDMLRYLSLYKWGGTYLDLDVIVMRNLSTIPVNYAGAESAQFVASSIINFDHQGAGHHMAEQCLHEFGRSFDGRDWGNNGPGVITRVLHKVCSTRHPALMKRKRCGGFEVFDIDRFNAVHWIYWRMFFKERVRVGSAYGLLAAKYCPRVYAAAGEYF